jgi:hypothetical protein
MLQTLLVAAVELADLELVLLYKFQPVKLIQLLLGQAGLLELLAA